MHDHPTSLDDYQWPICVTPDCKRQLWVSEAGRWACRPCEDATRKRLTELPSLFRQLNTAAALMRGASKPGGGTGGSKTPPIPPRLEVLALTANGGVATRLQAIEDSWRQALEWGTPSPIGESITFPVSRDTDGRLHAGKPVKSDRVYPNWRTQGAQRNAAEHVAFLLNNLPWACDAYESVGQDIDDLRRLHAECTAIVNDERRPGRVQIGACPARYDDDSLCGQPLTASAASHRVRCTACGSRWETLGEWRDLRAAQDAVAAETERQRQEGMAA